MSKLTQREQYKLTRSAECILVALPPYRDSSDQVDVLVGALQVMLDFQLGLASKARLLRRMGALAHRAVQYDAVRAGHTD